MTVSVSEYDATVTVTTRDAAKTSQWYTFGRVDDSTLALLDRQKKRQRDGGMFPEPADRRLPESVRDALDSEGYTTTTDVECVDCGEPVKAYSALYDREREVFRCGDRERCSRNQRRGGDDE